MNNNKEIAKEVLAVSLHVADAQQFDIEQTKKRMQELTQQVLQSTLLKKDQKSKTPQTIDLEFQQIDNLKNLLPHLANCSNLKELILHGNRLNSLPDDLSILSTVETLDISNNLFEQLTPVVNALKTMPKLFHLHIGLNTFEDEQFIIEQLPNLLTLNSKRIRFHDVVSESDQPSERQTERSQTSEITFNQEDIDNMEGIYNQICAISKQENTNDELVNHVKEVMIDFQQKVNQTQTHHFLNTHILKAKFDLYELCFKELIEYFRNNDNKLEQILTQLQQEHKTIFNDLANTIYNLKDYKKIKKNNNQLEELQNVNQQLMQEIEELKLQDAKQQKQIKDFDFQVKQLEQNLQRSCKSNEKLQSDRQTLELQLEQVEQLKSAIEQQSSQLEFQIAQMQKSARSENQANQQLLEVFNQFLFYYQIPQYIVESTQTPIVQCQDNECQSIIVTYIEQYTEPIQEEKDQRSETIKEELEQLECQNAQLAAENKKYLEMIIRHTKNNEKPLPSLFTDQSQKYQSESTITHEKRVQKNNNNEFKKYVQPQSFRPLILKQLKELIQEIYESKQRHDQRQIENKMSVETLEQHLYTFLNYKYGLKNLALEWAACIINGVKKYGQEDNDVLVFGKILKNEIDEDFRLSQQQCKITIQELLKVQIEYLSFDQIDLKKKYPLKHTSDIKEMVNNRMNTQILEEECIEILKSLYDDDIANVLLHQIKQLSSKQINQQQYFSREEKLQQMLKKEKTKYEYSYFIKVILDYQLKQYEDYLEDFVRKFRQYDIDKDGIITENDFRLIISIKSPEYVQKLLTMIDPFGTDKLVFSVIVRVLRNERYGNQELISQI